FLPRYASPLLFFFFNDTATTEIYTLSLHDALPISASNPARRLAVLRRRRGCRHGDGRLRRPRIRHARARDDAHVRAARCAARRVDRKSTRLNSSHLVISYAVFCLKKKIKMKT